MLCAIAADRQRDKINVMPRKIRELKAQISREGFIYLPKRGKGSHERWLHPLIKKTFTIPGKDGDDVPLYLEKQLAQLLTELKKLQEDEDQ
jgi:predicted RNA binding protein YcfA (HicA-like mRNA interferase family)